MKLILAILAILLFSSAALAQTPTFQTAGAPGCGPDQESFSVQSDSHKHPIAQPEAGKAIVYFLQDDKWYDSRPRPTTRWGLDGAWVGATQSNAYFYLSVEPGEHHLCSVWQSAKIFAPGRQAAATHFTALAGEVYCFVARDLYVREQVVKIDVRLEQVDPDEGQLLMSKFAFSTFQPKK